MKVIKVKQFKISKNFVKCKVISVFFKYNYKNNKNKIFN